jgi:hypothetical protein
MKEEETEEGDKCGTKKEGNGIEAEKKKGEDGKMIDKRVGRK